jgi:inorganic pyrophosphatase
MIDLNLLNTGKNPPHEINVVIEIPKGSNIIYEILGGLFNQLGWVSR